MKLIKSISLLSGLSLCSWKNSVNLTVSKSLFVNCLPQSFSTQKESFPLTPSSMQDYIKQIYAKTSTQRNLFSLYITGGGITAAQWLLTTAGASQCVQTVEVPYARAAVMKQLESHLSPAALQSITSLCSKDVALHLAKASYRNAVEMMLQDHAEYLNNDDKINIFGVGVTAALATTNPKQGDHRFHIVLYHAFGFDSYTVKLEKGTRSRAEEDDLCSQAILSVIGEAVGLPPIFPLTSSTDPSRGFSVDVEKVRKTQEDVFEEIRKKSLESILLFPKSGSASIDEWLWLEKPAAWRARARDVVLLPGSFNPVHAGHVGLAHAAMRKLSASASSSLSPSTEDRLAPMVLLELAVVNADKPPLALAEIVRRVRQFEGLLESPLFAPLLSPTPAASQRRPIVGLSISSEPFFTQKARLFPGGAFVIGADTFLRLLDAKYYLPSNATLASDADQQRLAAQGRLVQAVEQLRACGVRFLVGGRVRQTPPTNDQEVVFESMESLAADSPMVQLILSLFPPDMFQSIAEEEFRVDISSTLLRQQQQQQQLAVGMKETEKSCK